MTDAQFLKCLQGLIKQYGFPNCLIIMSNPDTEQSRAVQVNDIPDKNHEFISKSIISAIKDTAGVKWFKTFDRDYNQPDAN